MTKANEKIAQLALVKLFNYRKFIIIPNISYGLKALHNREVDLMVINKSNYATEIEIKLSLEDLKADKKKTHQHKSQIFKRLFFAVFDDNIKPQDYNLIPEHAGIIKLYWKPRRNKKPIFTAVIVKEPKNNDSCRKLTQQEIDKVRNLLIMRYWSLFEKQNPIIGD